MTDLLGRVMLTVTLVAMLLAAARAAFADMETVTPRAAIEQAIAQRLGGDVTIAVTSLDTAVAAERRLEARPEPGGRAGSPMRFVLMVGRVRRGIAIATVEVLGSYARAARPIARHERVAGGAVEVVHGELPPIALTRLPGADEVVGLTARRDIAAGEPLTGAVLQVPPLVRSGDSVAITIEIGAVEISARGTASGSGHEGDTIRVMPRPNGRAVKARITGPGTVEIVP
jgi:flagella basal body P-ring formation protein FlgA